MEGKLKRGREVAVAVELAGLVMAALLPGLIQKIKARFQGRRGTSPFQRYRELRRLWRKRSVAPQDTTFVYRVAPSVSAAALVGALLVVPVGASAIGWFGSDILVLVGLLPLPRFATPPPPSHPPPAFSLMPPAPD